MNQSDHSDDFSTSPNGSQGAGYGVGVGRAFGHHGELVQGALRSDKGEVRRFLVTLPSPGYQGEVLFTPNDGNTITGPPSRSKSLTAARLTATAPGLDDLGGALSFTSNIPEGLGLGSSTVDVVASIRAVADSAGRVLLPDEIAAISRTFGASGIQVAHSGTVLGLIFDPFCHDAQPRMRHAQQALNPLGQTACFSLINGTRQVLDDVV